MFLWHLAAILPTIAILYPLGFPQPEPGGAAFWMLRPAWIVLQVPVLALLVVAFGRFESAGHQLSGDLSAEGDSTVSRVVAAVGAVLAGWGVLGYARLGLEPFYSDLSKDLTVMDVNSARSLAHLMVAIVLLRAAVNGPRAAVRAAEWGAAALAVLAAAGAAGVSLFASTGAETTLHVLSAVVLAGAALTENRRRRDNHKRERTSARSSYP
jgi:hypothetical protein